MEDLRPLGVGELIDAAIRIYRSRAKTLLLAVAIPVVPVVIVGTLVSFSSQSDFTVDPATGQANFDGGDIALALTGAIVNAMIILVGTSIATAACFRSISGAYVGDDPDWRESLRFAFGRLWSVLGLTLLTALCTLLGVLACFVGVAVPLAFLSVAMPALLVEGLGAGASLRRSWRLVKGTFWRVLGVVLLSTLLATVFQSIFAAPVAVFQFVEVNALLEQVITALSSMVATVLVTPFTAAFTMALYVDLRVRKEGFDLVLWAQRLGNAPTSNFPAQPGAPTYPGQLAGAAGPWGPAQPGAAPQGWVPPGASTGPGRSSGPWGPPPGDDPT